jgi:ankyrin repeat protein
MTAAASAPETLDVSTSSAGDAGMRRAIANIRASKLEGFDATIEENPQLLHQTDGPSKTLLHFAAEVGRPDFVRHIVQALRNSNANQTLSDILNAQTKTGYTAMMLAVEQGNEDVVDYLLGEGARFDVVSLDGLNALDLAAHSGYASMATSLIWHGARVNESKTFRQVYLTSLSRPAARDAESQADQTDSSPGSTPLIRNELLEYASRNDVAEITECLARGVDLESTRPDGSTALMIAVSRNNIAAAELLLANGANLNAINSKGWTALMAAVRDANTAAVTFLLRHGADANHLSPDHWTALAEAAQSGHVELIDLLLAHGADTEARSSHDWTPLMHACYRGDKTSVNRLLRSGAQVENGSQRDETPMLLAAASGHVEIVQDLIAFGGSPDAKWASDEGLQGQGEIERTYQLGWTPLMVACQNGHEDVVRLLLGVGATRGARSPMSKNAVEIAKENGRSGILELLEQDVSGA